MAARKKLNYFHTPPTTFLIICRTFGAHDAEFIVRAGEFYNEDSINC